MQDQNQNTNPEDNSNSNIIVGSFVANENNIKQQTNKSSINNIVENMCLYTVSSSVLSAYLISFFISLTNDKNVGFFGQDYSIIDYFIFPLIVTGFIFLPLHIGTLVVSIIAGSYTKRLMKDSYDKIFIFPVLILIAYVFCALFSVIILGYPEVALVAAAIPLSATIFAFKHYIFSDSF